MLPEDLGAHLARHGVVANERQVRRLLAHAISPDPERLERRSPLSRRLKESVAAVTDQRRLEVVERVTDPFDKFVKYLFRSPDGALSEAVRIPLRKPDTYSV